MIKPTGKNILVRPVIRRMTEGGIHLPQSIGDSNNLGGPKVFDVVACAPNVNPELKSGDRVYTHSYTTGPKAFDDSDLRIISEDQVLVILNRDSE